MTFRLNTHSLALTLAMSAAALIGAPAFAQPPRLIAPTNASGEPFSFADLVEQVRPSVVSILVEREVEARRLAGPQFFFPFGAPDGFQFGPRRAPDGEGDEFGDEQTVQGQGSGFFIDAAGHVVTNNHVIEDAEKIEVRLADGSTRAAKLVGRDELTDLAVLKVDGLKGQPYVQFADDVALRVGDWVLAVGNPFGLGGSVTSGIVSAIGGQERAGQFLDYIQIDAPINRGNSGGPTFDLKGRVVGVNTAIYSPNGGSVGIGLAIPAAVAKATVDQLIRGGAVTRGWLGVSIQPVTQDIAAAVGRKGLKGALIASVAPDAPAARAGLLDGDIVIDINGQPIADSNALSRVIAGIKPGARANLRVLRSGQEKVIPVTIGARPGEDVLADNGAGGGGARPAEDGVAKEYGVRLQDLTPSLRQQLRAAEGVSGVAVVGVKPGSPAADAGLQTGVIILEIDGRAVATAAAARKAIEDAKRGGKEAVLLRYQFGDSKAFGALSLTKE